MTDAWIVGAHELLEREMPGVSLMDVFERAAHGAVADSGLDMSSVDGLFLSNLPGLVPAFSLAERLGVKPRWSDTTRIGGAAFVAHVRHAAAAIREGKCEVALIVYGSLSRSTRTAIGTGGVMGEIADLRETVYGPTIVGRYGMFARRHMHEFGTSLEQLAEPAVAAHQWARLNPDSLRSYVESVGDVLAAEEVASPLTLPMCCVITDGGGALVVASEAVAKSLGGRAVSVLGTGEAIGHGAPPFPEGFTTTAVSRSAPPAFAAAGVTPEDIDLCTIYDSFTITVITALEDAGFCAKGDGGAFVEGGRLGPGGSLPTNPDGGGLATNHPGMRGIFLVIEAVRQLRHEAGDHQVGDAELAFVQGVGGTIDSRHGAASLVLGR